MSRDPDTPTREDDHADDDTGAPSGEFTRRSKRGVRFWCGVIALALVGVYLLWRGALWVRVSQEIAAIRDAGQPASVADVNAWVGEGPASADNAAYIFNDAYTRFHPADVWVYDDSLFGAVPISPPDVTLDALASPTDPDDLARHVRLLADNADTLRLLREAATKPDCRFLTTLTVTPNIGIEPMGRVREMARLLQTEAKVAAERGDAAGAADALITAWRIGVLIAGDPRPESTMIAHATQTEVAGTAMRVLSRVQLTDDQLAKLLDVTADGVSLDDLRRAAMRDRALWLDGVWGDFTFFRAEFESGATGELQWVAYRAAGLRDVDRMIYLQYMADVIDEMSRPGPDLAKRLEDADRRVTTLRPVCGLTVQNIWSQLALACQQQVAAVRAFRAALAVERYRLAEGRIPASLADVTPRYLAAAPTDPFAAGPLRLTRQPDAPGFIIVSQGLDPADPDDDIRFVVRRGNGPPTPLAPLAPPAPPASSLPVKP
ncbi:MAG: hypothetical protein GC159_10730 [Phycisphaera sp.]|nr:hypothetical protein [Phycisphaera sp.]